jgi:hypothetical protein
MKARDVKLAKRCLELLNGKLTVERAMLNKEVATKRLAEAFLEAHDEVILLRRQVKPLKSLRQVIQKLTDDDKKAKSKIRRILADILG